jgi:hypothetical protein
VAVNIGGLTGIVRRYPVAWGYWAGVVAGGIVLTALPSRQASALAAWASTDVTNLHTHPVAALLASAFLPSGSLLSWAVLIPLAMFSATWPLGNWRLLAVCLSANVVGSLVSEGILAYRVDHGSLQAGARDIIDIGPSYVVVAAIIIALMFGSWLARIAAAAGMAVLVFPGGIFDGLGRLEVAPVGHVTSIVVAAILGGAFGWRRARRATAAAAAVCSGTPAESAEPGEQALRPGPAVRDEPAV